MGIIFIIRPGDNRTAVASSITTRSRFNIRQVARSAAIGIDNSIGSNRNRAGCRQCAFTGRVAADLDIAAVYAGSIDCAGNRHVSARTCQGDVAIAVYKRLRLYNTGIINYRVHYIAGSRCRHQHLAAFSYDRTAVLCCNCACRRALPNSQAEQAIAVKVDAERVGSAQLDRGEVTFDYTVVTYGRRNKRNQTFVLNGDVTLILNCGIGVSGNIKIESAG